MLKYISELIGSLRETHGLEIDGIFIFVSGRIEMYL